MRARVTKLAAGLGLLGALALGGSALAGAANTPAPVPAPPAASQSGSQSTGGTQSGDQLAADAAGSPAESSTESATEATSESASAPESDGPGGHADDPANSTVDNQFQGVQ